MSENPAAAPIEPAENPDAVAAARRRALVRALSPASTRREAFPWKWAAIALRSLVVAARPAGVLDAAARLLQALPEPARADGELAGLHARQGSVLGMPRQSGRGGLRDVRGQVDPGVLLAAALRSQAQQRVRLPDRQACQKCHTSYRQVSPNGDLLIPHRAHVQVLKLDCPVCHKDLVHSVNKQGFNRPEMETCLQHVPRRQEGHEPVREVPHPEAGAGQPPSEELARRPPPDGQQDRLRQVPRVDSELLQ